MKKIIIEEKVEVWIKRTRLVPENFTNEKIVELSEDGGLDSFECENLEALYETEELISTEDNGGYHTVKIYDENKKTIYINGKEWLVWKKKLTFGD